MQSHLYRCVDWNLQSRVIVRMLISSHLYRCVDWNPNTQIAGAQASCRTFTGAWIETALSDRQGSLNIVAPLQVRGLKLILCINQRFFFKSHLYRCVDWNYQTLYKMTARKRRTFTGAWIETLQRVTRITQREVAPLQVRGLKLILLLQIQLTHRRTFTGAWIETFIRATPWEVAKVAPLQVRGLKLWSLETLLPPIASHLYRCVDWNNQFASNV